MISWVEKFPGKFSGVMAGLGRVVRLGCQAKRNSRAQSRDSTVDSNHPKSKGGRHEKEKKEKFVDQRDSRAISG
jgi:hypothetical protein